MRQPPLLPPHWQPLAKRLPERQRGGVRGVRQSGEGGRGGGTAQLLLHPRSLPGWWHTLSWPAQEEDQICLEMTEERQYLVNGLILIQKYRKEVKYGRSKYKRRTQVRVVHWYFPQREAIEEEQDLPFGGLPSLLNQPGGRDGWK